MLETLNLAAVVLSLSLVLLGGPILFWRAGYPWNKVIFGTVTILLVTLAMIAMLSTIQTKTGLTAIPLLWLVPLAVLSGGVIIQRRLRTLQSES
jgi:hypothetical protein